MVDSWNENYNGNVTENKICCKNKICCDDAIIVSRVGSSRLISNLIPILTIS